MAAAARVGVAALPGTSWREVPYEVSAGPRAVRREEAATANVKNARIEGEARHCFSLRADSRFPVPGSAKTYFAGRRAILDPRRPRQQWHLPGGCTRSANARSSVTMITNGSEPSRAVARCWAPCNYERTHPGLVIWLPSRIAWRLPLPRSVSREMLIIVAISGCTGTCGLESHSAP